MICKGPETSHEADKMSFTTRQEHLHNPVSLAIPAEETIKLQIASTRTLIVILVARKAVKSMLQYTNCPWKSKEPQAATAGQFTPKCGS